MTGKKQRITPYFVITVILLILLAIFFLFPLYWIVTGSVKEKTDIIIKAGESVKWIPTTVSWDNFARLFKSQTELFGISMPLALRWLFNSVFISVVAMALTCITSSLAGYALAKTVWGSLFAVIFPVVGWPFGVFLMKQFSEGIPSSLLEAARIDGAGELKTFFHVALPIIKPGIGALAIFTFISAWNEYPMQLVMLSQSEAKTIALGIAGLQSEI